MKIISIIVPCFNEQETVGIFHQVVSKIVTTLTDYVFEIIFINDGSKDNTLSEILKLKEKDHRIALISFSRNFGKEAALLAGLKYANGDAVIVMDVDLQDPPELIIDLLEGIEAGYDVVYTKRRDRQGEPPIRSYFSKLFYKIMNHISEVEIVDGARDYRIMSRQVVESLLELNEKRRFSKGLFMWVGFDSKVIEFDHVERSTGTSKWSFIKLMGYAIEGIVSFSDFPLRLASLLGVLISGVAFVFLIYVLIKNSIFKNSVDGWASMTSIIVFLGGIQLVVLGVIGEYLCRIFSEVKNRPSYLIKELYESDLTPKKPDIDRK